MIYKGLELEIQENKIKVHDSDHDDQETGECHDFWNETFEGLILEILLRLPDHRSAVRCATVCRMWHSLILRYPGFLPRFKSQHQQHRYPYPPASTLLFRRVEASRIICQLFSEEWVFLRGESPPMTDHLDFFPSPTATIRASCKDMLLVSSDHDLFICNPITRQFFAIPSPPNERGSGYALLATKKRSKVVKISPPDDCITVEVFCSESRKWETMRLPYPQTVPWRTTFSLDVVTCDGVLYWLESEVPESVIYLDLSKEMCGRIPFPYEDTFYKPHRIGVVHGVGGRVELRLVLALPIRMQSYIHLKVWRLNISTRSWVLVHSKRIESPNKYSREEQQLVGHFVHPTDGDSVLVVWGQNVCKYDLVRATYEKVYQLLEVVRHKERLMPYAMVH